MRDNSDHQAKAYNSASRAAHEMVTDTIQAVLSRIQEAKTTDEDEVSDLVHEEVDQALIYTVTHWICAWGLPDASESASDMGVDGDFDKILATQAYLNLEEAVRERGAPDFEAALAINADAAEEAGK